MTRHNLIKDKGIPKDNPGARPAGGGGMRHTNRRRRHKGCRHKGIGNDIS